MWDEEAVRCAALTRSVRLAVNIAARKVEGLREGNATEIGSEGATSGLEIE